MIQPPPDEQVVANPTYMADIRFFFDQIDIDHMGAKGIELGTYEGVKQNAVTVFLHTAPPNADMPPEDARKWSAARSQTFKNWILAGYPVGAAVESTAARTALAAGVGRVRKNVADLSQAEIDTLTTAFKGILAKPITDSDSYCSIASVHGLPPPTYCLHHEDRYNPWHRVYLKVFEDALRAIPGCGNLTLPYWDISTPIPAVLQAPPFDSYVVPVDLGPRYGKNYKTQRYDQATINANLKGYQVLEYIALSMTQSLWGVYGVNGYQDSSIAAHDGGHLSTGPTMADQNIASFDPIFWFFHCNLDRLWLNWQVKVGATTLAGFKSTLSGNTDWLSAPFNALPPYAITADQTIDFEGISYDQPAPLSASVASLENKVGSIEANRAFVVPRSTEVSVLVKNIDRLNIPGSFVVNLLADGEPVAKRAFFQPATPRECDNCRKHGLVSVNFRIDQERIVDRRLSISIELPSQEALGMGKNFPLSSAGNPTINVRLLLQDG